MRALKPAHIAIVAALGAAFAILTTKARANAQGDSIMYVDPRVSAFLNMIGVLETGTVDSYNVFYGGSRFFDYSNHPVITGEMSGIPLSEEICHAAGIPSGICFSTAAGKYQINVPTWREFSAQSPALVNFEPHAQDEAAMRILQKIGALDALLAGDFDTALQLASNRWASLPGSTAKQNPKSYAYALSQYLNFLEA